MDNRYTRYTDEELFQLIVQNNKDAFVELYSRFRGRVYAYVLRMVGDRDWANDIFQEVFARLYQQRNNDNLSVANVTAYVFRTARNICLNALRDRKLSTPIEDFHQVTYQPSYENVELVELVKTALELLPEHYREVFVLREYDGLSYQEIADITGQTLPSVKIHLFRAKDKLRKVLSPYFEEV